MINSEVRVVLDGQLALPKSGRTRSGQGGAKARYAKLTKQQISEIGKKAANTRWKGNNSKSK